MSLSEEAFRERLDARGLLRADALASPERSVAYTVFAQRADADLGLEVLRSQASRFFAARLGLTVDKTYGDVAPSIDVARVVLRTDDGTATGTRLCFGRPATAEDHAAADRAERAQGSNGMAQLARRCAMVWLVAREADDDRGALTLAAIFASVMLGPILSPAGDELFGVRTARMKLEGRAKPYR